MLRISLVCMHALGYFMYVSNVITSRRIVYLYRFYGRGNVSVLIVLPYVATTRFKIMYLYHVYNTMSYQITRLHDIECFTLTAFATITIFFYM